MKRAHLWSLTAFFVFASSATAQNVDVPKAADPRLVVELVAAAPDIVHPIACDFDAKGRLLVIESHTHFAPKDYTGPKFDRIRMFDVSKPGTKPTTFFEGTRHTMDLAVHPDGSVYIATRNEILRLRDTKGTGVADEKTRIIFLDTKGDYPHNGLSGLCFDSKGDLTFGMGENLGAKYTLSGADGVKFSGEGDGGHIFHCSADGKKLRKVATGFWNPFGICRDIYGRTFCVDNDPDQSPPCRMVHVVEGGDYGFRFCYGRSGKHPFQSWHGTLPGTLPMMTGVGEAPCEILSYESDGLPAEYRGQLLVTTWADHRVERYAVKPHGASFKAERLPFVQGGNNFRPVGLCTAPDGSLYVTDWVLPNYNLHGKGAIWHIRWKDAPKVERPDDPEKAIFSMHRPLREAAARKLARKENGWKALMERLEDDKGDVRTQAASISALAEVDRLFPELPKFDKDILRARDQIFWIADRDAEIGLRELAIRTLVERNENNLVPWLAPQYPAAVQYEAIRSVSGNESKRLVKFLGDADPFLRHAATYQLRREIGRLDPPPEKSPDPKQRIGALLAVRYFHAGRNGEKGSDDARIIEIIASLRAKSYLKDSDENVRFIAAKWVADEKLKDCRKDVEKAMTDPKLSDRMYMAYATALARLDGKEVNEKSLADYFAKRLADDSTASAQRAMLLRQVPATHPKVTVELLARLLKSDDAALKLEAVRALAEHPNPKKSVPLLEVLRDSKLDLSLRGFAIIGLSDRAEKMREELLGMAKADPRLAGDVDRALAPRVPPKDRPPAKDLDAWLKRLEGPAADVGARIFFHPRFGCSKCHRIDGRGQDVGPDLSNIGNTDRRHILESILQPSANVAPHYVAWHLETADGKVRTGMLLHTQNDEYTYLDAKGERFKLKTGDLVEQRPTAISIMPEGLVDAMTDQEMRDLLAYLQARK
jgi:putative membrane-bound dehydrogenase-like protein